MADDFIPYRLTLAEIQWAKDLLGKVAGGEDAFTAGGTVDVAVALRAIAIARESTRREIKAVSP